MDTPLTTEDKKLIRLATAWADLFSAEKAYHLYDQCQSPHEEMTYHLLLSLVTCYGRPFLRRDGIGPVTDTDEYRCFPDFSNDEMNDRHYYFMALRNMFYAHTTLDGVRLKFIPPNVQNPDKPICRNVWDFNLGVRTFHSQEYKVHVRSAYPVIPELMTRLEKDIGALVPSVAKRYNDATTPFEIDTGAEEFDLKQVMAEMKKRDQDRQQKSEHTNLRKTLQPNCRLVGRQSQRLKIWSRIRATCYSKSQEQGQRSRCWMRKRWPDSRNNS